MALRPKYGIGQTNRIECKNGLRNVIDRPPLQGREGVGQ